MTSWHYSSGSLKSYGPLWLICLATLLPLLIAAYLYHQQILHKQDGRESGEFLQMPFSVNTTSPERWQLIYTTDVLSSDRQQQHMKTLSAIHIALGKYSEGVVLKGMQHEELPELPYAVYIASPRGDLILGYCKNQIGPPLLKDLKHLLKHNPLPTLAQVVINVDE